MFIFILIIKHSLERYIDTISVCMAFITSIDAMRVYMVVFVHHSVWYLAYRLKYMNSKM